MLTGAFQRNTTRGEFFETPAVVSLSREPSELVRGTTTAFEQRALFASEYVFRCGANEEDIKLVLVSESGCLKVDSIEPCTADRGDTGS